MNPNERQYYISKDLTLRYIFLIVSCVTTKLSAVVLVGVLSQSPRYMPFAILSKSSQSGKSACDQE